MQPSPGSEYPGAFVAVSRTATANRRLPSASLSLFSRAVLQARPDEVAEQRVRPRRLRLELGVALHCRRTTDGPAVRSPPPATPSGLVPENCIPAASSCRGSRCSPRSGAGAARDHQSAPNARCAFVPGFRRHGNAPSRMRPADLRDLLLVVQQADDRVRGGRVELGAVRVGESDDVAGELDRRRTAGRGRCRRTAGPFRGRSGWRRSSPRCRACRTRRERAGHPRPPATSRPPRRPSFSESMRTTRTLAWWRCRRGRAPRTRSCTRRGA